MKKLSNTMANNADFFMGALGPKGFQGYFDWLDTQEQVPLYLIKAGPGCGKSTLMNRLAQASPLPVERIHCSSDPDSLDGVIFSKPRAAIIDATAPHVVEPACAGAVERYVDLSQFYSREGLQPLKGDIIAAGQACSACYKRVYRCLGAAGELLEDVHDRVTSDLLTQKLARRARGIILREFKPTAATPGVEHQAFLSAVTYQGSVTLWETVEAQAGRVYELWDSYGLAHDLLAPILAAGLATGHQVVACPDPMAPQRLAHLIFPDLSLAFVTSNAAAPWPHHPYRRLRLDAMVDREVYRSSRPRLRFAQKVAQALVDQAVDGLRQAKAAHDSLEALYNPHVDFEGVYRAADQVAEEILSLPQ